MNIVLRRMSIIAIRMGLAIFMLAGCGPRTRNPNYDAEAQPSLQTQLLAPSSNSQRQPAIDGTHVVWSEKIADYWQIILFDMSDQKRVQLTEDEMNHVTPSISGDRVVWQQGPPGGEDSLAGVNWVSRQSIQLPVSRASPARINGTKITWNGEVDVGTWRSPIIWFDVVRQLSKEVVRSEAASWPSLDGDFVVWEDERNGNSDIFGYDTISGREFPVVVAPRDQEHPSISGNIVVWQDNRNGVALNDNDIYGYDIGNNRVFVISVRGGNEYDPRISDQIVAWTDAVGGNSNVYGYDLSTRKLFTVAADQFGNSQVDLSGSTIVWVRADKPNDRNAHTQIAYARYHS